MVKAGKPVDDMIEQVLPYLEKGDIVIDGGNSFFQDTRRRYSYLAEKGIRFVGMGVSGGEEGALHGPSLMPGGDPEAYKEIAPMFTKIAAQVADGPCCAHVGPDGAGHYVKMVHNGIEYSDMQLIGEAYHILRQAGGFTAAELHEVFAKWNEGPLDSYLIEITRDIMAVVDPDTGRPLVEMIMDKAGQKGTGKWTSQNALDLGVPTPAITEGRFCALYVGGEGGARQSRSGIGRTGAAVGKAIGKNWCRRCTMLCMPRKSVPMPRDSLCCGRLAKNTAGSCSSANLRCFGAVAASYAPASWTRSATRLSKIRRCPT